MKDVPVLRVAAIHDLSGFGRASLTVAIPILATMGIQVCPLPTAVLSSQTGGGMTGFTFLDLTDQMGPMMDHWASLGLKFDAVYSGFLGSPDQSELASRCIREFRAPGGIAVVDPVLGDNGQLDPTQTPEMVEAMRRRKSRHRRHRSAHALPSRLCAEKNSRDRDKCFGSVRPRSYQRATGTTRHTGMVGRAWRRPIHRR